ncbi:MAG TPA: O-antigen ligase family protein [Verrucomicrobiae bacterium]|nr:O-antigen ligase family protein [Verrucomicrobiae bacterium]
MDRERIDSWCEHAILGLVLLMLVLTPLAIGTVRDQDFVVVQWMTVAILALWVVRFFLNPKHRLLWIPLSWAVLAFALYAVARYWTADVEFLARQELIRVLVYTAIFFAVVNNLHRQETTQILGVTLIALAMLLSVYAIFQFLTASDEVLSLVGEFFKPPGYRKRGSGTFISPNNLAGYLEMVLPLAIAFTLTGRFTPVQKIFLGYASLVIFAGITVTISRGGWLGTAAGLGVLFLYVVRQRDYWKRSLVVLVVLSGVFIFFFLKAVMPPNRVERIDQAFAVEDVRYKLWAPAYEMWKDHLWFGVGPNHFDDRFRQYRPPDSEVQARPDRVHNDYLNTLVDWGITGAVLVLAAWVIFYIQVFRSWRFVRRAQNDLAAKRSNKSAFVLGGSLGLLAILVHSFFDFNMHVPSNAILAVVLLALVGAHYRFATERHWHTVRLPLRIPVVTGLAILISYLGWQSWQRSFESRALVRANEPGVSAAFRLAQLKRAMAVEPKNFETAYQIGEEIRLESWEGSDGYADLARDAIEWFKRSAALNPYNPHAMLRLGMCYDWIGEHSTAATWFDRAQGLDPNGYLTRAYIGWHHFELKDYAKARYWFESSRMLLWDATANPMPYSYLKLIEEREKTRGPG